MRMKQLAPVFPQLAEDIERLNAHHLIRFWFCFSVADIGGKNKFEVLMSSRVELLSFPDNIRLVTVSEKPQN